MTDDDLPLPAAPANATPPGDHAEVPLPGRVRPGRRGRRPPSTTAQEPTAAARPGPATTSAPAAPGRARLTVHGHAGRGNRPAARAGRRLDLAPLPVSAAAVLRAAQELHAELAESRSDGDQPPPARPAPPAVRHPGGRLEQAKALARLKLLTSRGERPRPTSSTALGFTFIVGNGVPPRRCSTCSTGPPTFPRCARRRGVLIREGQVRRDSSCCSTARSRSPRPGTPTLRPSVGRPWRESSSDRRSGGAGHRRVRGHRDTLLDWSDSSRAPRRATAPAPWPTTLARRLRHDQRLPRRPAPREFGDHDDLSHGRHRPRVATPPGRACEPGWSGSATPPTDRPTSRRRRPPRGRRRTSRPATPMRGRLRCAPAPDQAARPR